MSNLGSIGAAIGNAMQGIGQYTAQAASRANAVSFASQGAQGAFNQASANIANALGTERTASQYAYNSASAAEANNFTQQMWNQAAAYNTNMFEQQMAFNAEQAEINRRFQKEMDSTKYQRAIKDMKAAGLNPILAVTSGIGASGAGGSTASVSAPQMGSAQGAQASGGLLNGLSASEGNFMGQMEYMSGILGIIGAAMSGFSSAFGNLGTLGDLGKNLGEGLATALNPNSSSSNSSNTTGKKDFHDFMHMIGFKEKHGGGGYSRN